MDRRSPGPPPKARATPEVHETLQMMRKADYKAEKPKLLELLVVFAVCLAATLLIQARTDVFSPNHSAWSEPVDHWKYEYVAEHPIGSFHIQPICWRLGVPLLVRILPFSMYRNFEVVGISAFALCGLMVYMW